MSTRRWLFPALAVSLCLASTAFAGGEMVSALSLGSRWGSAVLGIARGLFPFMLLLALVVELVFRDPAQPASFRAPLWRAAIVLVLLVRVSLPSSAGSARSTTVYGWCVFGLAGLSDSIADSLAPKDLWGQFKAVASKWQQELVQATTSGSASATEAAGAGLGGYIFGALIALAMLVGQAAFWVVTELAKVMATLLYALGPLAVVFSIPKTSDSLSRWFRTYVSILAWPVLSAVMLSIIAQAGLQGLDGASPAFASIATALLMAVCACAVPALASSLVGGSVGAVSAGLAMATQGGSVATGLSGAVPTLGPGSGSPAGVAGAAVTGAAGPAPAPASPAQGGA